jgi:hypothetical protein
MTAKKLAVLISVCEKKTPTNKQTDNAKIFFPARKCSKNSRIKTDRPLKASLAVHGFCQSLYLLRFTTIVTSVQISGFFLSVQDTLEQPAWTSTLSEMVGLDRLTVLDFVCH